MPAAQELSSSDVCEQLKAAVQYCSVESLQLLLQLPAAQDIHSNDLYLLLVAAVHLHVRQDAPARVQALCGLSAAQQLSSSDVCGLLKAAVQYCSVESLQLLLQLPAAQDICSSDLHPLLLAAVRRDAPARVQALCELPAAQQLSSSQVCEALQATAVHSGRQYLEPLLRLPAAQAIGGTDLQPLLLTAVKRGAPKVVYALCRLPAAQQLSECRVQALLRADLERGDVTGKVLQMLCDMHRDGSLQQVSSSELEPLLLAAVEQGYDSRLQALCSFAAEARTSDSHWQLLLYKSMLITGAGLFSTSSVQILCRLPAAQYFSSTDLQARLLEVSQQGLGVAKALCELPHLGLAEGQSGSMDVQLELLALVDKAIAGSLVALCRLPAAKQLSSSDVEPVLLMAGPARSLKQHRVAIVLRELQALVVTEALT
jgi:hypothetical protein